MLDITGAIITIDAMGTQTEIAKQIINKKADYVLALKANHPTLYSQVKEWFEKAQVQQFQGIDISYDKRLEKAHHRTEIREVWTVPITAISELYQPKLWAGLQTLVMVVRVRHLWNKTTREVQFYLTSLHSNAQLIGRAIRKHWGIENQAHWTLDCTFSVRVAALKEQMLAVFALSTVRKILLFYDVLLLMLLTANRPTNVVSVKK